MCLKRIVIVIVFTGAAAGWGWLAYGDPLPAGSTDQANPPAEAAPAAAPEESGPGIPPGTVINSSNWSQYREYMTDGEIGLWEGKWFWKMPADAQINVGPTTVYPLPEAFVEAS